MKLKLNIDKIKQEMDRLGLTQSDVARMLGMSRQAVFYDFKIKPISAAEKYGKLFNLPPKDLIK